MRVGTLPPFLAREARMLMDDARSGRTKEREKKGKVSAHTRSPTQAPQKATHSALDAAHTQHQETENTPFGGDEGAGFMDKRTTKPGAGQGGAEKGLTGCRGAW